MATGSYVINSGLTGSASYQSSAAIVARKGYFDKTVILRSVLFKQSWTGANNVKPVIYNSSVQKVAEGNVDTTSRSAGTDYELDLSTPYVVPAGTTVFIGGYQTNSATGNISMSADTEIETYGSTPAGVNWTEEAASAWVYTNAPSDNPGSLGAVTNFEITGGVSFDLPQTSYATGTVSSVGTWTGSHLSIDEPVASDADYLESPTNPDATINYVVSLGSISTPVYNTAHTISVRAAKDASAGRDINLTVDLMEGTTVRATLNAGTITSNVFTAYTYTLTPAEAASITNYSNLRLRLNPTTSGGGAGRTMRFSWAEFSTAPSSTPIVGSQSNSLSLSAETSSVVVTFQAKSASESNSLTVSDIVPKTFPVGTSTETSATHAGGQRKVDTTSNGVVWAMYHSGGGSIGLYYSTNNGSTWTSSPAWTGGFGGTAYDPMHSFFIDHNDYAHVIYKMGATVSGQGTGGLIYYRRGTPNATRTGWLWSAPLQIYGGTDYTYPDIIAHVENTGWKAHMVMSKNVTGLSGVLYARVNITSDGTITLESGPTAIDNTQSGAVSAYAVIDYSHYAGTKETFFPDIHVAWSRGSTGAGNGIQYRRASYSGATWAWQTAVVIDSTRYSSGDGEQISALWDGNRFVICGLLNETSTGQRDLMMYERNYGDTTTTERILVNGASAANDMQFSSMTTDLAGNVYIIGRFFTSQNELGYYKWKRRTSTLSAVIPLEGPVKASPYPTFMRGQYQRKLRYIYTGGTVSPFTVKYGEIQAAQTPNKPSNVTLGNRAPYADLDVTWNYSEPEGDPQTTYTFRWRKVL